MRVVIFANGVIENQQAEISRWVRDGDVIIAADGGSNHLVACGIYPHHIIGDLDSITPELQKAYKANGVTFHTFPPYKDETDLELAILWAICHYPVAKIVILGAMGGRPDQALANLLLLGLSQLMGHDVVIANKNWTVNVIRGGETYCLSGSVGDTISLIPIGGQVDGVTTIGLAYPLTDETLYFGPARGVSNVMKTPNANISVALGSLWVFHKGKDV